MLLVQLRTCIVEINYYNAKLISLYYIETSTSACKTEVIKTDRLQSNNNRFIDLALTINTYALNKNAPIDY